MAGFSLHIVSESTVYSVGFVLGILVLEFKDLLSSDSCSWKVMAFTIFCLVVVLSCLLPSLPPFFSLFFSSSTIHLKHMFKNSVQFFLPRLCKPPLPPNNQLFLLMDGLRRVMDTWMWEEGIG